MKIKPSTSLGIAGFILSLLILPFTKSHGQLSDQLYNPQNFWLVDEENLLINDIATKDAPLRLFNIRDERLMHSIRSGRGPGEVSPIFYKRITRFSNGDLLLWDAGLKRIIRYNKNLEFVDDIIGNGLEGQFYKAGLINDSTLFSLDFTEEFLKVWRIRENEINKNDRLWSVNIDDYEELSPLSNFILLQTLFFTNRDGSVFMTCEYSSHVIGINEKGILYMNNEPDKIPIPVNDEDSEKSGSYSLPIMGEQPEGARDISVDEKYVYLLLNGDIISKFQQMRYALNFESLINKVNHAERLLIFDKYSGAFLKEVKLPIPARQAKVQNGNLFLLNSLGDVPMIRKFRLSEL